MKRNICLLQLLLICWTLSWSQESKKQLSNTKRNLSGTWVLDHEEGEPGKTNSGSAEEIKLVVEKTARTFDCRSSNEYRFVVVENPNRKKESDPVIPRDVNIVVGDEIISKFELPKESEVKNLSLNAVEKNKVGFEIRVDWGGGVYHYEVQFNFRCKENDFYLYRVKKVSFSTTNPDSGNFLDKKESKVTKIVPNLPIEKFVMTKYL